MRAHTDLADVDHVLWADTLTIPIVETKANGFSLSICDEPSLAVALGASVLSLALSLWAVEVPFLIGPFFLALLELCQLCP